jgi:hypothetical protein
MSDETLRVIPPADAGLEKIAEALDRIARQLEMLPSIAQELRDMNERFDNLIADAGSVSAIRVSRVGE